jgi:hypothetical protein
MTDSAKKRSRNLRNQIYRSQNITIGDQVERWRQLKESWKQRVTAQDLAKMVLDL